MTQAEVKEEVHVLRIRGLNRQREREVTWTTGDGAHARAEFDNLIADGFAVYAVDEATKGGTQLERFDPAVKTMEAIPAIRGGC